MDQKKPLDLPSIICPQHNPGQNAASARVPAASRCSDEGRFCTLIPCGMYDDDPSSAGERELLANMILFLLLHLLSKMCPFCLEVYVEL